MSKTENQSFSATKKDCQAPWKNHLLLEDSIGSSPQKIMSSQTRGPGALVPTSASTNGEHKAEAAMKSDNCQNRNDIAGQTIQIEWHVCLGDTSEFTSETGYAPVGFPDRIIFASMFNDITTTQVRRCKERVWTAGKKWSPTQQGWDLVVGVSVAKDPNRPGNTASQDLLFMLLKGVGQRRFSNDMRIYHQQPSCVQVFKHASNWCIVIKERKTRNALKKWAAKQSHAREYGIGVHSTLSVLRSEKWIQH